ncbi:hypothetical protein ADK59_21130 [Streptomyces sp. XY332]|nr:hypothetical protein ADK59_21130 [Streptomyces sp. XY332]
MPLPAQERGPVVVEIPEACGDVDLVDLHVPQAGRSQEFVQRTGRAQGEPEGLAQLPAALVQGDCDSQK